MRFSLHDAVVEIQEMLDKGYSDSRIEKEMCPDVPVALRKSIIRNVKKNYSGQ